MFAKFWVHISSTFSALRPFHLALSTSTSTYVATSTSIFRPFCQIWISYWSRSTGRSKVWPKRSKYSFGRIKFGHKGRSKVVTKKVEVAFRSVGRCTEKFELMRTQISSWVKSVTKIWRTSPRTHNVFNFRSSIRNCWALFWFIIGGA